MGKELIVAAGQKGHSRGSISRSAESLRVRPIMLASRRHKAMRVAEKRSVNGVGGASLCIWRPNQSDCRRPRDFYLPANLLLLEDVWPREDDVGIVEVLEDDERAPSTTGGSTL